MNDYELLGPIDNVPPPPPPMNSRTLGNPVTTLSTTDLRSNPELKLADKGKDKKGSSKKSGNTQKATLTESATTTNITDAVGKKKGTLGKKVSKKVKSCKTKKDKKIGGKKTESKEAKTKSVTKDENDDDDNDEEGEEEDEKKRFDFTAIGRLICLIIIGILIGLNVVLIAVGVFLLIDNTDTP